jgi:hypothetical protein
MRSIAALFLAVGLAAFFGASGCSEKVGENNEQHDRRIKARQAHEEERKAARNPGTAENKGAGDQENK